MKKLRPEYILIALASIAWGSGGVLFRWIDLAGKEQVVVGLRALFSLLFFFAVIVAKRDFQLVKPGKRPSLLLLAGLFSGGFGLVYFKALNHLSIGEATFIMYLAPIFIALAAPVFFKEKLENTTILCLALGLGGTAFLAFSGTSGKTGALSWVGLLFAFLSAVFYATQVVILKTLREDTPSVTIGLWLAAVTSIVFLPFALVQNYTIGLKGWFALAVLGLFHLGAVGLVYLYALRRVKAQHAGILAYLEPVSAMVFGLIFLAEIPVWQDLAGALLIIAAGVLIILQQSGGKATGSPGDRG